MPKFVPFNQDVTYSEANQANPIRWQLYYYDRENDTFIAQAKEMKCKDYFNDVVAKIHGYEKLRTVYGFDANTVKTNDEGVYIRVTNLNKHFLDNLNGPIRDVLVKDGQPPVEVVHTFNDKDLLLLFPIQLWSNTYTISIVTAMIRCGNYGKLLPAFEEWPKEAVWKADAFSTAEHYGYRNILMRNRTRPPREGFWMFYNNEYNSEHLHRVSMSTVHNCGFVTTLIGAGEQ